MSKYLLFLAVLLVLTPFNYSQEKPKIEIADLEKYTYYFNINGNSFGGDGSKFLLDEIAKSQFVMLGEYHGSTRVSEFTRAIIPIFSAAGCRTFALEIGPFSAEILSDLSQKPEETRSNLNDFNTKFAEPTKNRTFTPIPFFSGIEDADFLAEARRSGWRLIGLDQEGSYGYRPLLDRIYQSLSPKKQLELKSQYERAVIALSSYYEASRNEEKSHYKAILDSKEIADFTAAASNGDAKNKKIGDAIRFSSDVFYMNDNSVRKYYEANSARIQYMKRNLAEGFRSLRFDVAKDKMLLKMGSVHTGRGFSPLSLFEIGNTLSELAAFNGNSSLHIEFGARYYVDDGKEADGLADEKAFPYRYKAFLQMGKRDRWTVIDLRPLRKVVFYQRKFEIDPIILEIFKNHDLYIIPPVDMDSTPNYSAPIRR